MGKNRGNENEGRKESRERVDVTGNKRKKKRRKEADSDGEEKVFCLWKIWAYGLLLQKCGKRRTDPGVLK